MRILFVTARPPWPGRRGDQARVAGFVRELLAAGHEPAVLSLCPPGFEKEELETVELETVAVGRLSQAVRFLAGAVRAVLGLSPRPLQCGFFDHPELRRCLRRRLRELRPHVVVLVTSRLGHLVEVIEDADPEVPVVVDLVDSLTLNFLHRARRERLLAWLWSWESRRLGRWEAGLVARSAAATVVAGRDRRAVIDGAPAELRRDVEARLEVVPFGLDLPQSGPEEDAPAENDDPLVALTGNLGYFPTVDGAVHFARTSWPEVRRRVPSARWLLAGARPAKAVRRLDALDGVEVVADPPELLPLLGAAHVALAPMRSGSGTPIKILEAMALGVPVVATPQAAAGLDELPPEALAVAGDDVEFAAAVCELLEDGARRRDTVRIARAWVSSRHGLPASARRFLAVLERARSGRRPPAERSAADGRRSERH